MCPVIGGSRVLIKAHIARHRLEQMEEEEVVVVEKQDSGGRCQRRVLTQAGTEDQCVLGMQQMPARTVP